MSEDIQSLAAKHQREIISVQENYTQLLEEKDREIAAYLKEQKLVTANQQKDLENLHQAHTSKIAQLEQDHRKELDAKQKELQSKTLEIRWLEDEVASYETRANEHNPDIEQLRTRCETLEAEKRTAQTVNHNLRQEADSVRNENNRLME
jgi:hypothetical protein